MCVYGSVRPVFSPPATGTDDARVIADKPHVGRLAAFLFPL
jgi:hypothetical protein